MWLERNSMNICQLAVSYLKLVRHDLIKEQKNVRVYILAVSKIRIICHNWFLRVYCTFFLLFVRWQF